MAVSHCLRVVCTELCTGLEEPLRSPDSFSDIMSLCESTYSTVHCVINITVPLDSFNIFFPQMNVCGLTAVTTKRKCSCAAFSLKCVLLEYSDLLNSANAITCKMMLLCDTLSTHWKPISH